MPLFEGLTNQQAAEPSPTEIATEAAKQIKQHTKNTLMQFAHGINQGFLALWRPNVSGVTPAMIAEKLGADGLELCQAHAATVAFLEEQIPELATEKFFHKVPAHYEIVPVMEDGKPTGAIQIVDKK
jgi:hypothetical protein